MANDTVLEFRNVTFSYGNDPVVEDISLRLQRGEFMALVGPNGGGKTTLLKLALGLLQPKSGRVYLWDRDVSSFRDWHKIGYVPQKVIVSDSQFPATVSEVVGHGEYRGVSLGSFWHRSPSIRVKDSLESLGIWHLRNERFSSLSLGMQQRVLIARSVVKRPELLVLDEPTASIDIETSTRFYDLLQEFHDRFSMAILVVSHDIGTVLEAVQKVACVNRKLVFHGYSDEFPMESLPELYGLPVHSLEHHHKE